MCNVKLANVHQAGVNLRNNTDIIQRRKKTNSEVETNAAYIIEFSLKMVY